MLTAALQIQICVPVTKAQEQAQVALKKLCCQLFTSGISRSVALVSFSTFMGRDWFMFHTTNLNFCFFY